MDRIQETSTVLININRYRNGDLRDYELIRNVCEYFDNIKNEKISQADLRFLKFIASVVGIPHFYDLLEKFEKDIIVDQLDLNTLSSFVYESSLHTDEKQKVHKYQKQVIELFEPGKANRFFLSASTSFGKTHIVFEIIKKMSYTNVLLIFPTIALLSENLDKLLSNSNYSYFPENYSIHTLSEIDNFEGKNIFIYTPERFLSFIEKNESSIKFDFAFIDEIYKIDNEYLIDEEVKENERDTAYRLAAFYTLKTNLDVLLAGPYIDFSDPNSTNYNSSFDNFLKQNNIELINYNDYEIVNKSFTDIKTTKVIKIDDALKFEFQNTNKTKRLVEIIQELKRINENTIIYCSSRSGVEAYAKILIESKLFEGHDFSVYQNFLDHISKTFNSDWVLIRALKNGVGIHHSLVPKYIQKEVVSLFNKGFLKILISTTTITEGVNTSAKNLIVLHSKKGSKELKKFDAKNIAGRAGRFLFHYSGRVLVLQNNFMKAINSEAEGIKHKNYDITAPKDEIDLFYTGEEYLTEADRTRLDEIQQQQLTRDIPDYIFNQFKVISRVDKIKVYDEIKKLSLSDLQSISTLIRIINFKMDIDYNGFQIVLNVISTIIKNQKVKFLIEYKDSTGQFSVLTNLVHFYLQDGFIGSMRYKLAQGETIDVAIKETADFVYNILKYQVVKYVGVFNIMYKFYLSQLNNIPMQEVPGLDRLLVKFEYNALTQEGRIASDYGVPANVVEYYEDSNNSSNIKLNFDNYEMEIFNKIDDIINKSKQHNN